MILVGDYAPGNKLVVETLEGEIVLCNLEVPVLPHHHSLPTRPKAGPNLFSERLPVGKSQFVFTLANNHIMDYGLQGLLSTKALLMNYGIKFCGAGVNVIEARKPLILMENKVRIGIISCCEAQFGVARDNQPGVAEIGPWLYRQISELINIVDKVIVSVHAAIEDSPWPSPFIREFYHSLIDVGVDVVHGHHSHVPQGYESYRNGVILYGMGNFAVDPEKWEDYPNGLWSLGLRLDFSDKPLVLSPFTLEIKHKPGSDKISIVESNLEEQLNHKHYLDLCNLPFTNTEILESLWHEVALRSYYHYGANYMGFTLPLNDDRWIQFIKGLSCFKKAIVNKRPLYSYPKKNNYLLWYHMISCESHRQMLVTALGILSGEIIDLRTIETGRMADEMMPWSKGE